MFHSSMRLLLSSMWLTLLQWRSKQYAPVKHWYTDTRLHSITYHRRQYSTQSMPRELHIWQYSCSNYAKLWYFPHFMWNRNLGHVVDSTLEERIYFFWWEGRCPGISVINGEQISISTYWPSEKGCTQCLRYFYVWFFQIKNNVSQ